MRVPGFGKSDKRVIVDPTSGREYVEAQPGVILRSDPPWTDTAYTQGRVDAGAGVGRAADQAYVQGRQDERAARPRRSGGLLATLLLLLLIVAAVIWALNAYRPGTLTRAGAVAGNAVDAPLTAAHEQAAGAADAVKSRTGQAVENAGQALTNQGEKLKSRGEKIKNTQGN